MSASTSSTHLSWILIDRERECYTAPIEADGRSGSVNRKLLPNGEEVWHLMWDVRPKEGWLGEKFWAEDAFFEQHLPSLGIRIDRERMSRPWLTTA